MTEKSRFRKILSTRFRKTKAEALSNAEELRLDFKERYHNFKLLLNANNKALEIMAEIEQALQGKQPFGMSFVRTSCLSLTVNILRLLQNLEKLSGGKYNALFPRFDAICKAINEQIAQRKVVGDDRRVIPLAEIDRTMADVAGNKMANLGEIANRIGLRVPDGFVITARACQEFFDTNDLQNEIDKRFVDADNTDMESLYVLSGEIGELILNAEIPPSLAEEITYACDRLRKPSESPLTLAVRSSAGGEDSAESSFAGQYHSELNVRPRHLLGTWKAVIASKYSLAAITYRLNRGIPDEDIAMSVGCIVMVDALAGGAMYTRNPIDPADSSVIINSAWGLPKAVVDGSINGDLFIIRRTPNLKVAYKEIRKKLSRFTCFAEEGICRFEMTGERKELPSITDDQATALADLALQMEQYYGSPQDIEWAIDQGGEIYILQCRPLRQVEAPVVDHPPICGLQENVIASGGHVVCPGAASGEVFLVNSPEDMIAFPRGAVLVARQALPLWASLLNRAAAVLTEQGAFAGHLANVAREFKVPAIFGISEITRNLKAGDLVTVDAVQAVVYRGRIDISLPEPSAAVQPLQGSPVYNALREVSRLIVPLNLLDPYASGFKPENCRTYHDITRFAHEKAVQEMFNFGLSHNFSERSSKQLYYKVPMQWWILNLDDGFTEEIHGKYVRLENIASIPMLALWEGITAVPWQGPPPLDRRGFASVMFGSTANRGLEPGMRSAFTERNYFMISKDFCSFTSRLGYHFSIVEALVSEREIENYISFQFKGGAADASRRGRRVRFIGDIIGDYGFRVEIRQETLISRLEGFDRSYMLERLRILGYLVIHTRQLDMIMSNPAAINYYRSKIGTDITSRLLGK